MLSLPVPWAESGRLYDTVERFLPFTSWLQPMGLKDVCERLGDQQLSVTEHVTACRLAGIQFHEQTHGDAFTHAAIISLAYAMDKLEERSAVGRVKIVAGKWKYRRGGN